MAYDVARRTEQNVGMASQERTGYIYNETNNASDFVMSVCCAVPANPSATPLTVLNSVNVAFWPIMGFRGRYAGFL